MDDTTKKIEERTLKGTIIADLANAYYEELKNESQYINMKFEELGAVCRDLATQDVDTLILEEKIDLISWCLSRTSMDELKRRFRELEIELEELQEKK